MTTPRSSFWVEADWKAWEKAGRPRVPRHLELKPPPPVQEIGNTLPVAPPGPQLSPGFRLFAKPKGREAASAQSRGIDRWLEAHSLR